MSPSTSGITLQIWKSTDALLDLKKKKKILSQTMHKEMDD